MTLGDNCSPRPKLPLVAFGADKSSEADALSGLRYAVRKRPLGMTGPYATGPRSIAGIDLLPFRVARTISLVNPRFPHALERDTPTCGW